MHRELITSLLDPDFFPRRWSLTRVLVRFTNCAPLIIKRIFPTARGSVKYLIYPNTVRAAGWMLQVEMFQKGEKLFEEADETENLISGAETPASVRPALLRCFYLAALKGALNTVPRGFTASCEIIREIKKKSSRSIDHARARARNGWNPFRTFSSCSQQSSSGIFSTCSDKRKVQWISLINITNSCFRTL